MARRFGTQMGAAGAPLEASRSVRSGMREDEVVLGPPVRALEVALELAAEPVAHRHRAYGGTLSRFRFRRGAARAAVHVTTARSPRTTKAPEFRGFRAVGDGAVTATVGG